MEDFNSKTHAKILRKGELVVIDKQILRWRRANKRRHATAGAEKARLETLAKSRLRNIFA